MRFPSLLWLGYTSSVSLQVVGADRNWHNGISQAISRSEESGQVHRQ